MNVLERKKLKSGSHTVPQFQIFLVRYRRTSVLNKRKNMEKRVIGAEEK